MPENHKVVGKTDRGLVRPGNEDYLHIDEKHAVYAVCDGMGGHQAGEVASMTASETIRTLFDHFQIELLNDQRLAVGRTLPQSGELLLKAIRLANRRIYTQSAADSSLAGMGTTIVAVALEHDMLSIAHVGDSRAYRLEDKILQPLTRDHSWVSEIQENQHLSEEEALSMVGKNVITRALGVRENVEVDYRLIKVKPGDIFILCSDGLCGYAADDEIFEVATKFRNDLKRMVDNLIQLANDRGGSDNVTVIALEIGNIPPTDIPEVKVFKLPAETSEMIQAEDEWLTKLTEFQIAQAQASKLPSPSSRGSKAFLVVIFVAFAILAAVFIYLQAAK